MACVIQIISLPEHPIIIMIPVEPHCSQQYTGLWHFVNVSEAKVNANGQLILNVAVLRGIYIVH